MTALLAASCGALAALCLGLGWTLWRSGKPAEDRKEPRITTTKLIVWACLLQGFAWVWCSYILAYLGRVEIAESLSKSAITVIISVVLEYNLKSLAENLSKNNDWPDKPATKKTNQDCD